MTAVKLVSCRVRVLAQWFADNKRTVKKAVELDALATEIETLEGDLVLALKTAQTLQAGIGWFNVDQPKAVMEMLYEKYAGALGGVVDAEKKGEKK